MFHVCVPECQHECVPDEKRVQNVWQYYVEQDQLLATDPYRADRFDPDRPITDQLTSLMADRVRTCPVCGNEREGFDGFQIEYFGHGIDPDHPRLYDAYGRRLTYTDATTSASEQEVLAAVEVWCTDALTQASRAHYKHTGRYLAAAELRRLIPTTAEIARARGGSRSRLSTWINRHMPMRAAIQRVQPSAAERAIALLRQEGQLDASAA